MSLEDFKALTPTERTAFFLDKADDPQVGLVAYAQMYVYISGNSLEALPAAISVDNDPKDILKISTYALRFALSFEPATADKVLAGSTSDLTTNNYAVLEDTLNQYAPVSARVLGADATDGHGVLASTFISAGGKAKDVNGTTYIDIVTQLKDGTKASGRYYFVTNGTAGMWELGALIGVQ
jgi:hypothetical protein